MVVTMSVLARSSQPVQAIIPSDVPALVYNTRYYVRDYRRNNHYARRTVGRAPLDMKALLASMPRTPEDVSYAPRAGMVQDRGV